MNNLNTEFKIIPAWNMAIKNNKITKELIFHSDKGTQYTSYRFTNILKSIIDWQNNTCIEQLLE